jgi:hypothetical protein
MKTTKTTRQGRGEHIVLTSRRTGQRGGDRVCHHHPFHTPVAAV